MGDPMARPRTILHADMDAFYAAIEQRDDPRLRGVPVIVGGLGRRGVVATASYEARRFGVHSALPGAIARRRCPDGVFVQPRMEVYGRVSQQVREVFDAFTPLVEPLSLDEAFLDVTDSVAAFGTGEEIAAQLKAKVREVTSLTVSVGVATSKFVAKVASDLRKPDGLVVVEPGREREFLAPLPVSRLWGAGPVTQKRLAALGWRTIADLQKRSEAELARELGPRSGAHFWALCRGEDPRRVESQRDARSISHEVTFERDVAGRAECHKVLMRLSEQVGRRLRRQQLRGGVVVLKVRFPPFETKTRQTKLDAPTDDDLHVFETAAELFDTLVEEDRPVRLLGVGVAQLVEPGAAVQLGLFDRGGRTHRLNQAMDAIRDRFGDDAIRHGGSAT